jgi:hypothetical protein
MASELERATWVVEKGIPAVEKDIPALKFRIEQLATFEAMIDQLALDTHTKITALESKVTALEKVVDRFFQEQKEPVDPEWEEIRKAWREHILQPHSFYAEKPEKPKKGKK